MEPQTTSHPPSNTPFALLMLLAVILLFVGVVILVTMGLLGFKEVVEPYFAGSTTGP